MYLYIVLGAQLGWCLQLPHMIPHYNFLRKPPADFGWDWGPALAPAGIYGGVLLVAYKTVYITGDLLWV